MGLYISGSFKDVKNAPFSSGWGGTACFSYGIFIMQFSVNHGSGVLKFREGWDNEFTSWKTVTIS